MENWTALICEVMKLGAPDHTGKPAPIPTGETIRLEADMVIKATGQKPFEELVRLWDRKQKRPRLVDENHSTSISKVFAGGDCVNGGKEVVDAVQAGKEAAAGILAFIEKSSL